MNKHSIWKPIEAAPVPRLALDAAELALSTTLSKRTVDGLAAEGKIPSVRVGTRRLFPVALVEEWLRENAGQQVKEGSEAAQCPLLPKRFETIQGIPDSGSGTPTRPCPSLRPLCGPFTPERKGAEDEQ